VPPEPFRRLMLRRPATAYRVIDEDEILGDGTADAAGWAGRAQPRRRPALAPLLVAAVALVFMGGLLLTTHRSTPPAKTRLLTPRPIVASRTTLLRVARATPSPRPAHVASGSVPSPPTRTRVHVRQRRVPVRRRLRHTARSRAALVVTAKASVERAPSLPTQSALPRLSTARETADEFGFER
jgi:hypothetical protein